MSFSALRAKATECCTSSIHLETSLEYKTRMKLYEAVICKTEVSSMERERVFLLQFRSGELKNCSRGCEAGVASWLRMHSATLPVGNFITWSSPSFPAHSPKNHANRQFGDVMISPSHRRVRRFKNKALPCSPPPALPAGSHARGVLPKPSTASR